MADGSLSQEDIDALLGGEVLVVENLSGGVILVMIHLPE